MKKTIVFGLLFILILASCSILIEKRRYNKGLHVEIGRNRHQADRKDQPTEIRSGENVSSTEHIRNEQTVSHASKSEKQSVLKGQDPVKSEDNKAAIKPAKETSDRVAVNHDDPKNLTTMSSDRHHKKAEMRSPSPEKQRKSGDGYVYGMGVMMTLLGFGALRLNRNVSLKYTRLASSNPYLSKGLITLGYSSLGVLGYLTGTELYHMGTDISDTTQYVLGSTMVIAGGALYAYEKRSSITVWNSFYKRKLGHLIIGASMFGCLVSIGNGIQDGRPQYSPVGYAISYADNSSEKEDNNTVNISTSDASDSLAEEEGGGGGMMALYIFLAIVVLIMTVILTCMVACSDMAFFAVFIGIMGLALTVYLCVLAGRSRSSGV